MERSAIVRKDIQLGCEKTSSGGKGGEALIQIFEVQIPDGGKRAYLTNYSNLNPQVLYLSSLKDFGLYFFFSKRETVSHANLRSTT